ncbi:hypothetical protein NMG60_11003167 [Bertholletia excelsa]
MPDNRQVQSNGGASNSSNPSVDDLEEAVLRLDIQTNDSKDGGMLANSCPYPDRPGEPDCTHYLRTGLCSYGSNCRYNHPASAGKAGQYRGELPERIGQPDCGYYLKTGVCKYGSTCKYHHPRDRRGAAPVQVNMCGLPMRQEEKACAFYMRTGMCKYGLGCKFHHPQPAATGTVLPVPGLAGNGSSGLPAVPSSGLPFVGGVPTLSFPRAPYIPGPRIQSPQTYVPVLVPPSQGSASAHGWNTYLGSMNATNSVSSTSVLGSDLYNYRNHGTLLSPSVPQLPERPDQPECRHFMNTGSCKYGSDCKYHHPRERIVQSGTNSLGPLGLPLRPGQAVCLYYSSYGLCKYGPTCKFDHPLTGYPYNYGFSFPTLPVYDTSFYPYQINTSTVFSSEISPSKLSKVTDWNRHPEAVSSKIQNMDAETSENSSEPAGSPSHPLSSSELPREESE